MLRNELIFLLILTIIILTYSLFQLTIVLRMDDKMNRQLTSCISPADNPKELAQELVHYGFINEVSYIVFGIWFSFLSYFIKQLVPNVSN